MVLVHFIIIIGKLRLRLIQPECADPQICIILFALFPYILTGPWIGGIHKYIVAVEDHLGIHTGTLFYQKALLLHFLKILTAPFHLRPYRHHSFNPPFMKGIYHLLWFREKFLFKTPVAAMWPVIIIDHQHIQRDAPVFVLLSHI